MTPELAVQWIAFATQLPIDHVHEIGLEADQLVMIAAALAQNPLFNFADRRRQKLPDLKTGEFVCACGCGERFTAQYRTKRPKYKNEAHRQRYWRRRQREKREAQERTRRGTPAALVPTGNGRGFKIARSA